MEKGQTNNPNGRPKGTPNKLTTTVRKWLIDVLNENREQFESDLKTLKPAERIEVLLKLLPYLLPKVANASDVEGAAFNASDVVEECLGDWELSKKTVQQWYEKPADQQSV